VTWLLLALLWVGAVTAAVSAVAAIFVATRRSDDEWLAGIAERDRANAALRNFAAHRPGASR